MAATATTKPTKKKLAQKGVGTPIKILHEAVDLVLSVEVATGELYRGKLIEMEDNMNCQLEGVTVTDRSGEESTIERVYLRGSQIVFFALPGMLSNAPMFTQQSQGLGLGRVRAKHAAASRPPATGNTAKRPRTNTR